MALKTSIRKRRALKYAALSLLFATNLIAAQAYSESSWPAKPVKIIVPFAPGGTTDLLARAMAPELSKAFGQVAMWVPMPSPKRRRTATHC
jgi:tripartite-type tricarboxylate transporter receptor subunit TctC